MKRDEFVKSSAILGGATLLPINNAFTQSLQESGMDKLVDAEGNFELQPLPYAKTFLEPHMDEETLYLHHTFHHGGAVKGANNDLAMIKKSIDENSLETVDYWTRKLSYHLSSHILHTIFWTNLSNKKTHPTSDLLKQIEKDFGTYDKLQSLIAKTSKNVDGNGWGILGYHPSTKKLSVLQCENHEHLTQWGIIPILVIDVWEHSYYLKYRNRRSEFVDNLFNVLNWDNVAQRFDMAKKIG